MSFGCSLCNVRSRYTDEKKGNTGFIHLESANQKEGVESIELKAMSSLDNIFVRKSTIRSNFRSAFTRPSVDI